MPAADNEILAFRVHLTNLAGVGLGAEQLAKSLLPALECCDGYRMEEVYLPSSGALSAYQRVAGGTPPIRYRRWLPNSLSRFLECTVFGGRFSGPVPLLVLGDLPLRARTKQVLFVQTPLLADMNSSIVRKHWLKYSVARLIFRWNFRFVSLVIVQTEAMRDALMQAFPRTRGMIAVILQPVPEWLLGSKGIRTGRRVPLDAKLRLFYPASGYPHKNHSLLGSLGVGGADRLPIHELTLTIPEEKNPNPLLPWIRCMGVLGVDDVLAFYGNADALLFLSKDESYGFPLVEAMWVGLPVLCPDRPYARAICGDQAIYFDADDSNSLGEAIRQLHSRLASGWWPDWSPQLQRFPNSWRQTASAMLRELAPRA